MGNDIIEYGQQAVSLPGTVEEAVEQWTEYQKLTQKLLDPTDYQDAGGGKRFKKKSAWRKYAKAFNISDHIVTEQIERRPDGWPRWARVRVAAVAPNGRTSEADHECHISERCCPVSYGEQCGKRHTHCEQECSGRSHWSHPGDIVATATTRAKNRAISDLIGAGEVSAEEMDGHAPRVSSDDTATSRDGRAAAGADDAPRCPTHPRYPMRAGRGGGHYCSSKAGEGEDANEKGFCNYRLDAAPVAAPAGDTHADVRRELSAALVTAQLTPVDLAVFLRGEGVSFGDADDAMPSMEQIISFAQRQQLTMAELVNEARVKIDVLDDDSARFE